MKRKLLVFLAVCLICTYADIFTIQALAEPNESLIKNITVSNGEMVQFDESIHSYSVLLFEGETQADILATPRENTYTVQIEGNDTVTLGKEVPVSVYVFDTMGNSEVYNLKIYASSDNEYPALDYIACNNGLISPKYREGVERYYITLENDQSYADLDIRTYFSDSKVTVTGNSNLDEGKRTKASLIITNPDGSIHTYELYIYRKAQFHAPINPEHTLSYLKINNETIKIDFKRYMYYYEITVPSSVDFLNITAMAENKGDIVKIIGSTALNHSKVNLINILVYAPGSDNKSVYTLRVSHDSLFRTPKFTTLQVFLIGISTVIISVIIMIFITTRKCWPHIWSHIWSHIWLEDDEEI